MKFIIKNKWLFGVLCFLSGVSVVPLFAAAGLPSPLGQPGGSALPGIAVFLVSWCGILGTLNTLMSFILKIGFLSKLNTEHS
ncbi:hypothetical protein [Collimonas humicola]|uniref:hypothetical protein n=1 Tax=Collimonas humicola TaxID=2825886 RepID=UPI001B8D3470|nr:hypothetical protein [Collimonas humicola]